MMFGTPTPTSSNDDWGMHDQVVTQPSHPRARVPMIIPSPTIGTPMDDALKTEQLRGERIRNQKAEKDLAADTPATAPGDVSKTGEEYLATLTPPMQAQVKALSEGRLPIPTGAALKSPQVMQLWAAASQYDPQLDASTYPSRRKAFQDRTSGTMARNITSANTVLGHLDTLDKAIDELHNYSQPLMNRLTGSVDYALGDKRYQAAYANFLGAKNAAVRELTKVFRGTGGNVADIKDFESELDPYGSPAALHQSVKTYVDLLGSRVNAMGDQYGQAMGSPTDPMTLLSPKASEVFRRLGGEAAPIEPSLNGTVPPGQHAPLGFSSGEGPPIIAGDPTKDTETTFSTPQDKQLVAETTALYNDPNSTREDFNALNAKYGAAPLSKEILDNVFQTRERGGMITFAPAQSGRKTITALEGHRSQDASSEVGSTIVGAANGITAGHIDEITGGINALAKGTSLSDEVAKADFAKHLIGQAHPGYNLAGEIAGGALGAKGLGGILGGTRLGLAAARAPLAVDAGYGALYGEGENNDNRLGGALSGAVLSPVAGALGRKVAQGVGSLIAPTGGALRPLYDEGVRPTLGQRLVDRPYIGPAINATEEALSSIPVFGGAVRGARQNARDQFQLGAFNSALREIGDELPKGTKPGTDPHAYAQKAFGQAYDKARDGMQFVGDEKFIDDFKALSKEVLDGGLEESSANRFKRIVIGNVERRLKGNNTADGGSLKDMQSALSKRISDIRNSPSGDHELAGALEDLSTIIDEAARRNSTPAAVAALDAADKGYAKLVRIETASQGAGEAGKFTPLQFDNAVKKVSGGRAARSKAYQRGDALMQDYATAGRSLTDRLPNSGTMDRAAALGALGGGAYISPAIPATGILATAPYWPGIRSLTTALAAPRGDGPLGRILNSVGSTVKKGSTVAGKATRQAALNRYGQGN